MAVTSTIEYCTDRDLQDVYPHIAEYDLKRRIYNWVLKDTNEYISYNSGLVTVLFADGIDQGSAEANEAAVTEALEWFYDSSGDYVRIFHATNPNTCSLDCAGCYSNNRIPTFILFKWIHKGELR